MYRATKELQASRDQMSPQLCLDRLCTALEVLESLQHSKEIQPDASARDVCSILRRKVAGIESATITSNNDAAGTDPLKTVARYAQESDFPIWKDRLRVLGADFRCAADVFALVNDTRRCLKDWGGAERLHLLVNNAAQTLTDSVRKEKRAIEKEVGLLHMARASGICVQGSYKARVRGGGVLMALGGMDIERGLIDNGSSDAPSPPTGSDLTPTQTRTASEIETYGKSSWVQSLFEIPYEDVISAHSANTFLSSPKDADDLREEAASARPEGYIINVSSREGIFEDRTRSIGKAGKHVHTNMSKAGLNMITETEAASAWQSRRVAMNTVDPGYMSAAPEYEGAFDGQRLIG
ncbi:hypothetical protein E8E12_000356 [Didymella heteroderae]|uniref:Oxidoreductase n=1 Tax=Didymella heteroderae TaxID=1769908 RepID=A0A9P5BUP3_9PLEO|nr:hypothetical protein E8E12_000356 [Didymella heteroderae]